MIVDVLGNRFLWRGHCERRPSPPSMTPSSKGVAFPAERSLSNKHENRRQSQMENIQEAE